MREEGESGQSPYLCRGCGDMRFLFSETESPCSGDWFFRGGKSGLWLLDTVRGAVYLYTSHTLQ